MLLLGLARRLGLGGSACGLFGLPAGLRFGGDACALDLLGLALCLCVDDSACGVIHLPTSLGCGGDCAHVLLDPVLRLRVGRGALGFLGLPACLGFANAARASILLALVSSLDLRCGARSLFGLFASFGSGRRSTLLSMRSFLPLWEHRWSI